MVSNRLPFVWLVVERADGRDNIQASYWFVCFHCWEHCPLNVSQDSDELQRGPVAGREHICQGRENEVAAQFSCWRERTSIVYVQHSEPEH